MHFLAVKVCSSAGVFVFSFLHIIFGSSFLCAVFILLLGVANLRWFREIKAAHLYHFNSPSHSPSKGWRRVSAHYLAENLTVVHEVKTRRCSRCCLWFMYGQFQETRQTTSVRRVNGGWPYCITLFKSMVSLQLNIWMISTTQSVLCACQVSSHTHFKLWPLM